MFGPILRFSACVLALPLFAGASDGLGEATVEVVGKNGKSTFSRVRLERQDDGAWRYRLRTIDMPRDAIAVRLQNDAAWAKTGDQGWWMVDDGRWGAFTRQNGKGVQSPTRLPLFGMKRPDGTAFAAIVKGMRYETFDRVEVTNGVYRLFAQLKLSSVGFDPYEDWIVDFYPLSGKEATYSGIGRTYRKWQLGRGEVKPLAERIKGNPALAYAADSIFLRCKFGRCDRTKTTREDWLRAMPPVLVEHTFADFKDIMRRCREIGIDKAEMCFVGFQKDGHDGPFPDLFPADERFGGQAGMKDAIAYGKSLGYRMNCHINQNNFYRNARRWNLADVAKNAKGEPLKYTVYPGGQVYYTCKEVICNRYMDRDIADMRELGLNGLFHVDVTSATYPNVCHDVRHPNNRSSMRDWQIRMGEKARAAFGGFSSECGIDHVAPILDNVLYASCYPGWHSPKTDLVDGYFPVWHVVYSGIMLSNPFYATIDAPCSRDAGSGKTDAVRGSESVTTYLDSPERRTLKVFELNGRPTFYYTDYADLRPIKRMYDRWQTLKHLQFHFLEDHAEIAPNVFRSRYSNGEEVVCNYTEKPFVYRGRTVPSLDFVLCPPLAADLPVVDLSEETERQVVIAEGTKERYEGHPTTLLADDGKTMFCVWTTGHGGPCGPMARSEDGGLTWKRMDAALPAVYARTHRNCPTLQKFKGPDGKVRYFIYSSKAKEGRGLGILASEDLGRTWVELPCQAQLSARMPPTGAMTLKDGTVALFGQVFKSKVRAKDRPTDDQAVWMAVSKDGGKSFGEMRLVAQAENRNLCEPCCLRSPDGKSLVLLMRENRHQGLSMMCFSKDEGRTWTDPVDTPRSLTGDRHEGILLPDGRYVIAFRDQAIGSPTRGQFMAWVGTFDDLVQGREGQCRLHLLKHHPKDAGWSRFDTGYPGVELLPDGTIVCTTYSRHFNDERQSSVVSMRFKIDEIDRRLQTSPLAAFFDDLPVGTDPGTISRRITDQFLSTRPEWYFPAGYHGNEGYGWGRCVQYSVVSLWLNALSCARLAGDKNREQRLIRLFDDFLPGGRKNRCCSRPYHVDDTIFGALPYEIYLANGDRRCLEMGNFYADTQWTPPSEAVAKERHNLSLAEQAAFWKGGYTPQTRLWIDDMYMITVLQSQAYRATGDRKYIDRAAKEMCLYLDRLQLKDGPAKGLFYHAPDVPFVWARGDGWMAAGMALVLDRLPADSPYRARILDGYRTMMATLLQYQRPDGLWCQIIDRPTAPENWGETSGSAMFAYAYLVGVRCGWLDAASYGPAARKAWLALCGKMDAFANVADVCVGTGKKNDLPYYYARPRVNGDPHGQAPLLWMAGELMGAGVGRVKGIRSPEESKLFEKRIDPESGVVSYALVHGERKDNRQSLYFTAKSMTDDGRFLVFTYNTGNERTKCGPRKMLVADLLKDEISELTAAKSIPFIETKENYLVYGTAEGFFRHDLANPTERRKLCALPADLTRLGRLHYLYTHLTLTPDRRKAFLDSCWSDGAKTNYVQGLINLSTGAYESWGKTDFYCNHGQINPVRDDIALCAWEECFRSSDGKAYRQKTGIYPRMWLVTPDGRRELVAAKERNTASHEVWDDNGLGFSWCGGGVYHHDLATGRQDCWCPNRKARHNMVSPDGKFVVYDEAPEDWWRGCRWRVGFWNRETGRNVWVYSTRPALMPKERQSKIHPDPHPQFVCQAKYVVSTANNADGHTDLYVTPVDQLVRRTTLSAPKGRTVTVTNPARVDRPAETVSVAWKELGLRAGDPAVRVWDVANANPVPFQDDGHGHLIFSAVFKPEEVRSFTILTNVSLPQADLSIVCWSRYLPERMDDYAWENDRYGARVYGPIIMEPAPKGQKLVSSGVDIINKCVREPVLHRWFVERTGEGSYHRDHGEGMDNYKVGPSRGCGGLGALGTNGWSHSRNWSRARTFSIGPVRTEFELVYPAWGGFGEERRIVRLDRGQPFSRFSARFSGKRPNGMKVGPGLDCSKNRQHDGEIVRNLKAGWIANFEPDGVDAKDSGSIMTAILLDPTTGPATTATDAMDCEYLFPSVAGSELVWWSGATWTGAREIRTAKAWHRTVENFSAALRTPLKVEVEK